MKATGAQMLKRLVLSRNEHLTKMSTDSRNFYTG